jgi:NADH-quinone oxidoreductase subunit F
MKKGWKMRTIQELKHIIKTKIQRREADQSPCIVISAGTCGRARGSLKVEQALREEISKQGLQERVEVKVTGCHGFCEAEPNIIIKPEGIFYQKVSPDDVSEIVSETLINNRVIDRLLYTDPNTDQKAVYEEEIPFYKKQNRLLSGNNSLIDPTNIDDYFAVGGYSAFLEVLDRLSSEEVIEKVKQSGLRGRGGAGFPTGYKWEFCKKAQGDIRYLICNADEGDPGAYMDRSLLEGNPHAVIEGMLIGAYAMGAKEGWIYVRHEYPLAVKNLGIALEQAKENGLLGENILGTGFSFDIKVATGAGAFVCGEETALIASIEGKRGMPRQRPPFPVRKGLWGKPTNINNVETWANVPLIIKNGADWYTKIGTEGSKGTKIFSLVGKIRNTGLVEVPMGITLREIVYDVGGGIPGDKKFKAVQTGGPSGGCIPSKLLSLPVDYDTLAKAGSIMGSGGMIVMDERTCMVDVAKYFLKFLQDESCGKCLPCRKGVQKMLEIVTDITEGKATEEDLQTLEELAVVVRDTSLCGLGQTAPNPVLATLHYFRNEYLDHVNKKRCEAAVCKELISSPCQHTCPIDTEAALYISLIAQKKYQDALQIIKKDNPFASVLARVCHHPCEVKCRAAEGGEAIKIRNLKRFVTDYGLSKGWMLKAEAVPKNRKGKMAVVGSGPAGLTCAFYLAQKGYEVTVFEKHPVAGGMLAVGIPGFRLPREILNTDIDYIKSAGVEIRTNCTIGEDLTLDDLLSQGYKAVFVATGAHKSLTLGIPGEDSDGVLYGMEVLTAINSGKKIKLGRRVGVIGGGNSAVDAARAVLRSQSVESVSIFYRRTRKEMPAYEEEVDAALEEGVNIQFLTAPKRIVTENGKLFGCEFMKMKMGEVDDSGRRRPIPVEGSEFTTELDTLIVSIGEEPDTSFARKASGLDFSKWGTLVVDSETLVSSRKEIFAGGDVVTGPNTVVDAVASGKIAAESIDQLLSGRPLEREYRLTRPSRYEEPVELSEEEAAEAKPPSMPHLASEERKGNFKEVELGLNEKQAIKEARRCLRCDLETEDGKAFLESLKKDTKVAQEVTDA